MNKRLCCFLMILALALTGALPALADGETLKGYSKTTGYQYVSFGAYPTDADGGRQPILWRVLRAENGEAFLLSEYILFAAAVDSDAAHYAGWEGSDLYAYLNDTFKNDAFSAAEQQALLCRTEDQALVTLLSGDESKDAALGFSSNALRQSESTAWAKRAQADKGAQLTVYRVKGRQYSPWWLRTRSTDNPLQQRRVMDEGKTGRLAVDKAYNGVRPAIYVALSQLETLSGSGTMEDPIRLSAGEAAPALTEAPAETPAPEADMPSAAQPTAAPVSADGVFTAAANPAGINARFPALTEAGFLPEGEKEFVLQDEEAGLWLYASQTLRIEITRRTGTNSKKQPLRWYEAQVYTRDSGTLFDLVPFNREKYKNIYTLELADKIARQNHLVFAINSDYFIYRVTRQAEEKYTYPIGTVIRDGEIFYDVPRKANSTVYPPLDTMALYPDGNVKMFKGGEITGQALLDSGATDTLSFGPILVENGQVSPRSKEFGNTPNPRTGFGMVEPGHYICLMVESRIAESKGESCVWMGEKMAELGCQVAINLDGGATSTMIFMGKQVNKSGNYGDITNRKQNELLGIGYSEAVQ